jgi:hypothetical protein
MLWLRIKNNDLSCKNQKLDLKKTLTKNRQDVFSTATNLKNKKI